MPLVGEIVILREERAEDQPFFVALRNDLETQAWNVALPPDYTLGMYMRRFEAREFSFDRREARFTILHRASERPAGYMAYSFMSPRMDATLGIMVAREFWGTGVAHDANEVMLRFLFVDVGLRVVRLWTHSGNPRAIRVAEKSGFRISGRVREAAYKDGKLLDSVLMDILREEYFARHPELTDTLPGIEKP